MTTNLLAKLAKAIDSKNHKLSVSWTLNNGSKCAN